jgi:hypothetical protein
MARLPNMIVSPFFTASREHSVAFREHSGNIQGTFRKHSGNNETHKGVSMHLMARLPNMIVSPFFTASVQPGTFSFSPPGATQLKV